MKYYIAGVDFKLFGLLNTGSSAQQKVDVLLKAIEQIHKDAEKAMGPNATVLITLHEYALTPDAISNHEKKQMLNRLKHAVNQYNNLILIPGSFAAYAPCGDNVALKQKLLTNYRSNENDANFKTDALYMLSYLQAKNLYINADLNKSYYLQNSSYLLAPSQCIKHKKSYPWNETQVLNPKVAKNSLFYIGADSPVKKITLNNQTLDIGLLICREHLVINSEHREIKKNLPPIQVLISDTITLNPKDLFGALNIHMDSKSGLSVHLNDRHIHASQFDQQDLISYCYYPSKNDVSVKKQIPITHFNQLTPIVPNDKKTASVGCPRIFSKPVSAAKEESSNSFGGFKKGFLG